MSFHLINFRCCVFTKAPPCGSGADINQPVITLYNGIHAIVKQINIGMESADAGIGDIVFIPVFKCNNTVALGAYPKLVIYFAKCPYGDAEWLPAGLLPYNTEI